MDRVTANQHRRGVADPNASGLAGRAPMPAYPRRAILGGTLAIACSGLTTRGADAGTRKAPIALRRGVNAWPWFSLTREYPAPRTDYAWPPFQSGRPVPSASDLARLHGLGFDFIRIPVDPGPFLAFDGQRRATLLDQLSAAVTQALDSGLSVVVNLQANAATHYWTPDRMVASTGAPSFAPFADLVGTVASRLALADRDRVALEPVNEPPQACPSAAWVEVQTALFSAARAAAPDLTLVATGACGGMISGLQALDPRPFLASGPVLFTFHFYEPYLFSHQGAPWMREPVYRALNRVPWPASRGSLDATLTAVRRRMAQDTTLSDAAKRDAYRETERVLGVYFAAQPDVPFIAHYLGMARDWATRHDIEPRHVLMGEFGALRTDARYTAAEADDRARYVRDVRQTAEGFGFPWCFWDLFDGMGLMDDATRAVDPSMVRALGLGE